jgi:hypothetical protein
MTAMSGDLLQHWREVLSSNPGLRAKVVRFLISCYPEQAERIGFPPPRPPAPPADLNVEARPKLPKSPAQIRSLLVLISEAVRAATSERSR